MKVELMVNWDNSTIEAKDKIEDKIVKNILNNPRSFEYDLDEYFDNLVGMDIFEMLTEENKNDVAKLVANGIVEYNYELVEVEV